MTGTVQRRHRPHMLRRADGYGRPPFQARWITLRRPARFIYENVVTGEKSEYFGGDLPIGLDNKFEAGRFYKNIFGITYKCEAVTATTSN